MVGLKVIAVADAGAPMAKIAGADIVVNYRQDQTQAKMTEILNGERLQYALDEISEKGTTKLLASLFDPFTKDARMIPVLYISNPFPEYIFYPQTKYIFLLWRGTE